MLQTQVITLDLDGITAGDYLAHCLDADPPLEATRLRSVAVEAQPLDATVVAVLRWDGMPPPARAAAATAGLQLTADVAAVRSRLEVRERRSRRRERSSLALAATI
jgi:hypothetical protein